MKKFRFQLLAEWIVANYKPCKVADIGGGKGLLSHLLNQAGFSSTVIDPLDQPLPVKYREIGGRRVKAGDAWKVDRVKAAFAKEMAPGYDLLVGLHAHGSGLKMIEASAEYGKEFVMVPCCLYDEPVVRVPGLDWFDSLESAAKAKGLEVGRFELNFRGKNRGLHIP
jgi:hypothetical protein